MNPRWLPILALLACRDQNDEQQSMLREYVKGYCDHLASDVRHDAEAMKKLSTYLDGLESAERAQAEAKASAHPLSMDFRVRLERTDALLGMFNFCIIIRDADDATRERLQARGVEALMRMRGRPLDDASPAYDVTLKALEDLSAVVVETNSLALRK